RHPASLALPYATLFRSLQILDDGRVTDSQGHTVDFRNTVIIMTSNIGAAYLLTGVTANGSIEPSARDKVLAELRGHFRPEFLNRDRKSTRLNSSHVKPS